MQLYLHSLVSVYLLTLRTVRTSSSFVPFDVHMLLLVDVALIHNQYDSQTLLTNQEVVQTASGVQEENMYTIDL